MDDDAVLVDLLGHDPNLAGLAVHIDAGVRREAVGVPIGGEQRGLSMAVITVSIGMPLSASIIRRGGDVDVHGVELYSFGIPPSIYLWLCAGCELHISAGLGSSNSTVTTAESIVQPVQPRGCPSDLCG